MLRPPSLIDRQGSCGIAGGRWFCPASMSWLMPAPARHLNFALLLGLAWAVTAAFLLADRWPEMGERLFDGDDAMRLVQVREFLAGQSWFDLHEARLGPPTGYDTHWSRLIDAGLAGLFLAFRPFADADLAERLMRAVWPLLWLVVRLGGGRGAAGVGARGASARRDRAGSRRLRVAGIPALQAGPDRSSQCADRAGVGGGGGDRLGGSHAPCGDARRNADRPRWRGRLREPALPRAVRKRARAALHLDGKRERPFTRALRRGRRRKHAGGLPAQRRAGPLEPPRLRCHRGQLAGCDHDRRFWFLGRGPCLWVRRRAAE